MIGNIKRKIELLKELTIINNEEIPAVIALQEVTLKSYEELITYNLFSQHSFSLKHRYPGIMEGKNRSLGCFIATTGGVTINDEGLIERSVFPERTLKTSINFDNKQFEVICFHSLTGVDYKKAKSAHFASLVDYLHSNYNKSIILCGDFNEPKIDHIDVDKIVTYNQKGDRGKYAEIFLKP